MSKPDARHEALCRRCGRCCYEKYVVEERVFTSRVPCVHLDEATMSCRIYEKRLERFSRCMDIPTGILYGVFPADCPYVQNVPGYVASEEGWLDEETVRLIEAGKLVTAEEVRRRIRLASNQAK